MIEREEYGTTAGGQLVYRYSLRNANGVVVQILDFGGIITSILVPSNTGAIDDITTGFDTLAEYERNPAYFGCIVGRVINRIHLGRFTLDGQEHQLVVNDPPNHIHGGIVGFDKKVWTSEVMGEELRLSCISADEEENYPGEMSVRTTYSLNDDNELLITCEATTNKPTIVNLTNHAYFNLAGHKAANVYDHVIGIDADYYLPKTADLVPSGVIADVTGTLFDLRQPITLGDRIHLIPGPPDGYDHNFCISSDGSKKRVTHVLHEASGRTLTVYTDQPGIQLYTGNYLDGLPGKDGAVYRQHSSLALEAQNYPDAINHANFPSCVLRPGERYVNNTWYQFGVVPTGV